jgi:hypothetical protein
MADEQPERDPVVPITSHTMTREELIARWPPTTPVTLIRSSKDGYTVKRRVVVTSSPDKIVFSQAEGTKKGKSEPAEIVFQEGDIITEEFDKRAAITIRSIDGHYATYVEGFLS